MNFKPLSWAVLGLAVLAGGCTIGNASAPSAKGRVFITAGKALPAGIKPAYHSKGVQGASHRLAGARVLDAATDITSLTYTLKNLDTGVTEPAVTMNLSNLTIDLTLNPGSSYRITVDVAITASAPGTNVGVSRYGDQADFTVDPYYDTYVDLFVHPTVAAVFDPVTATTTVSALNPTTKSRASKPIFGTALTAGPLDKFFYSPDAKLFYFNRAKNAVFQWKDITKAIASGDKVLDGAQVGTLAGTGALDLYAACADPATADTLWVVGKDPATTPATWYYVGISAATTGSPTLYDTADITNEITNAGSATTTVATGIAVDSTWSDVYISFYNSDGASTVQSGVLQYYSDSYQSYSVVNTYDKATSTPANIYTDVSWDKGKLWALTGPVKTLGGAMPHAGTANLVALDEYMNLLDITDSTGTVLDFSKAYSASVPALSTSTAQLVLPNRFAGPIQGTVLYLSQTDFAAGGTGILSAVDLEAGTVASY
jgi:hypothetical protein